MYSKVFPFVRSIKFDLLIIIASIAIFMPFLLFIKPVTVGDGSQYYALSLAWKTALRPFMTNTSWIEYGHLVDSGQVTGLRSVSDLKAAFPTLSLGSTADFQHFWFYSLCAAVVAGIANIIGIKMPTHTTFLVMHYLFLTSMLLIAWRSFRWKGLAAASMLTFLSPIVWYLDKVHTEFFTYCVTISAVILFLRKRYIATAFFLALASTQNMSFVAVSLFALGLGTIFRGKEKYSGSDVALLVLTLGVIALHPAYYFFRFGSLDPVLLTGGARVGANLQYAYIWFFDPDIGLFPNWPFGMALLAFSVFGLHDYNLTQSDAYRWPTFFVIFVSVSLGAQVSTTNLNSGATPGVARYALWYLGLFFPVVLVVINRLMFSRWFTFAIIVLLVFGAAFSISFFRPTLPERYTKPSFASFWLQKNLPSVYDPPPEIFAERYSGIGEDSRLGQALAVMGPDCHKILLINQSLGDGNIALGGTGCGSDMDKLWLIIKHRLASGAWGSKDGTPVYVSLNETEFEESRFVPILGNWYIANAESNITGLMLSGWSIPENWATWSESKKASLTLPCSAMEITTPLAIELEIYPFVSPTHPQVNVSIYLGTDKAWSGILKEQSIIKIELSHIICGPNINPLLEFVIGNPASPASFGLSSDSRLLGVALLKLRFIASGSGN